MQKVLGKVPAPEIQDIGEMYALIFKNGLNQIF